MNMTHHRQCGKPFYMEYKNTRKNQHTHITETEQRVQYVEKMIKPKRFAQLNSLRHSFDERRCEQQKMKKKKWYNAANELAGGKILFSCCFFSAFYLLTSFTSCSRCYRCQLMIFFFIFQKYERINFLASSQPTNII